MVPVKGRTFFAEDDQSPGQPLVAVISHAFWQNQFQADPAVVGRTLHVNGIPLSIAGVMLNGRWLSKAEIRKRLDEGT